MSNTFMQKIWQKNSRSRNLKDVRRCQAKVKFLKLFLSVLEQQIVFQFNVVSFAFNNSPVYISHLNLIIFLAFQILSSAKLLVVKFIKDLNECLDTKRFKVLYMGEFVLNKYGYFIQNEKI